MNFEKLFYSKETAKNALFMVRTLNESKCGALLLEKLREKNSTLKGTAKDKNYRIINYWTESGLLDTRKEGDKTWRRYSVFDTAFVNIICELNGLGVPTKKIRETKEVLYSEFPSAKNKLGITILEFLLLRVATEKDAGNLYLYFDKDSTYTFFSGTDIKNSELIETLPTASVIINLNRLLKNCFGGKFDERAYKEEANANK